MPEKRMLIVPAEIVRKIDENRGDMSQADFIDFLIDAQLKEEKKEQAVDKKYATKEEVYAFEQDMRGLLKTFLEFFITYGLDMGQKAPGLDLDQLTSKLENLEKDLTADIAKGKATIKWK